MYEGYGPAGVAVLVDIMTDNRNRAASEIRHIFSRNGGNLGEAGCVAWMFNKKGSIVFDKKAIPEEVLIELALEAGAEDVKDQEDQFEVITSPEDFASVKTVFDEKGLNTNWPKSPCYRKQPCELKIPKPLNKSSD